MPRARQVPKRELKVIFTVVPAGERVPPLIFRLVTRWSKTAFSRVVVGWNLWAKDEDEELFDVPRNAGREPPLSRCLVLPIRRTNPERATLEPKSGNQALILLRVREGFRFGVELVEVCR